MKICHVCLDFPPRRTRYGSGTVNDALYEAQLERGDALVVVTPGRRERTPESARSDRFALLEIPVELTSQHLLPSDRADEMFETPGHVRRWNEAAVAWLGECRPLDDRRPDVVHSDGWTTHGVATSLATRYGCPLITTAHVIDRHYAAMAARPRPSSEDAEFRAAEHACVEGSDQIVVPSDAARGLLVHYFPAAEDKARVAAHGLWWDATHADGAGVAAATEVIAHYVGRLMEERGWRAFLEAFVAAARLDDRLRLRVIGDGRQLEEAMALHRSTSIEFLGPLSRADVLDELRGGDIYCNPALMETFGIAELEAMGAGLCVISNEGFGKHTHVDHLATGIRVPFADDGHGRKVDRGAWIDWLTRLADDPTLRRRLGTAAATASRRDHSARLMAHRLDAVYRDALKESLNR